MQPWVDSHMDWVTKVTEYLQNIKKRTLDNFLIEWLHGSFPLNEAGILIVAHAYNIHVAVFFNDSYWTTTAKSDLNKCKVFLLYRGSLVFEDSRRVTVPEYTEHRRLYSQLEKNYTKLQKDREKEAGKPPKKHTRTVSRNAISSDSESESDQNIMLEKASDGNIMPEQSSDRNIMPSTSGNEEKAAEKQGNMPSDNSGNSGGGSPEEAGAADIDLERIMETAESDNANDRKENLNDKSHSQSSSSSSSSASSNDDNSSDEQSSSEDTEYICGTATCGEVYPLAAALQAHECKHSLK